MNREDEREKMIQEIVERVSKEVDMKLNAVTTPEGTTKCAKCANLIPKDYISKCPYCKEIAKLPKEDEEIIEGII